MTKLPEISQDNLLKAVKVLVIACINTGAKELKVDMEQFSDPDGKIYGDYKVKVKKIK